MSIYGLAAELGKAISEDARMIRMEAAKKAYESDGEIFTLLTEYNMQREALTSIGDEGGEIDTEIITRIQDRLDELYDLVTKNPKFIELDEAQTEVNELMENVNNIIKFNATGESPCTHDCSTCGGCH